MTSFGRDEEGTMVSRDHSRSPGVRFTFRRSIILIAYVVLLSRGIIPLIERFGSTNPGSLVLASLVLSPPLLALLVAFIERPGPLKNWAVLLLIGLFFPALVLHHDCTVLFAYLESGRRPSPWATVLINALILANALPYVGKLMPRRCPTCRRPTLVPLLRAFKKDKRTANTCWCASCGGKFWKDKEGNWRIERRTTWIDEPKEPSTAGAQVPSGVRPEASGMPHGPLGGRAASDVHSA